MNMYFKFVKPSSFIVSLYNIFLVRKYCFKTLLIKDKNNIIND